MHAEKWVEYGILMNEPWAKRNQIVHRELFEQKDILDLLNAGKLTCSENIAWFCFRIGFPTAPKDVQSYMLSCSCPRDTGPDVYVETAIVRDHDSPVPAAPIRLAGYDGSTGDTIIRFNDAKQLAQEVLRVYEYISSGQVLVDMAKKDADQKDDDEDDDWVNAAFPESPEHKYLFETVYVDLEDDTPSNYTPWLSPQFEEKIKKIQRQQKNRQRKRAQKRRQWARDPEKRIEANKKSHARKRQRRRITKDSGFLGVQYWPL